MNEERVREVVQDEVSRLEAAARLSGTWTIERAKDDREKQKLVNEDRAHRRLLFGFIVLTVFVTVLIGGVVWFIGTRPGNLERCELACRDHLSKWSPGVPAVEFNPGATEPNRYIPAVPETCECHP